MNKHTEGPWTEPRVYKDGYGAPYYIAIYGNKGKAIVHHKHIIGDSSPYEEATANARLIAAAPELLEAAEEIVHRLYDPDEPNRQQWLCSDALHPTNDDKDIVDYLKGVIHKAKGKEEKA